MSQLIELPVNIYVSGRGSHSEIPGKGRQRGVIYQWYAKELVGRLDGMGNVLCLSGCCEPREGLTEDWDVKDKYSLGFSLVVHITIN